MLNRLIVTLCTWAALCVGCASTIDPAACIEVDVTPIPGEPISSAHDACGSIQNVSETVHGALGCAYAERPDYLAACPYRALARPIPEHTWQQCAELIRSATSCGEVFTLQRLCSCEVE